MLNQLECGATYHQSHGYSLEASEKSQDSNDFEWTFKFPLYLYSSITA